MVGGREEDAGHGDGGGGLLQIGKRGECGEEVGEAIGGEAMMAEGAAGGGVLIFPRREWRGGRGRPTGAPRSASPVARWKATEWGWAQVGGGWAVWTGLVGAEASWAVAQWGFLFIPFGF